MNVFNTSAIDGLGEAASLGFWESIMHAKEQVKAQNAKGDRFFSLVNHRLACEESRLPHFSHNRPPQNSCKRFYQMHDEPNCLVFSNFPFQWRKRHAKGFLLGKRYHLA